MRLCYIVDYRSPIAQRWISHFIDRKQDVLVITTGDTDDLSLGGRVVSTGGLAHYRQRRSNLSPACAGPSRPSRLLASVNDRIPTGIRSLIEVTNSRIGVRRAQGLIDEFEPDLVHVMRIPWEGTLAIQLRIKAPVIVSIWGNDFLLYALRYLHMNRITRRILERATGLHADCERDIVLATAMGFSTRKPHLVVPSGGGVDRSIFKPLEGSLSQSELGSFNRTVMNPRGAREYVKTSEFLIAMRYVIDKRPDVRAICVGLRGNRRYESERDRYGVGEKVIFTANLTAEEMANALASARVVVSPSVCDGTPNSLLEGMACGALPVVGDIPSVREWIIDGRNGLLADATNPRELAQHILRALTDDRLAECARAENYALVAARADRHVVMEHIECFYNSIAG